MRLRRPHARPGGAYDIAERSRRERYLEAQRRLAVVCAAGRPLDESWKELLKAIGEPLGWCAGGAWLVDETREQLRCAEFWAVDGLAAERLETQSRTEPLRRGAGAVGIAWERDDIVWIDLDTKGLVLAREAVLAAGIRSGIALPLRDAGEVVGALEFFSDEPIDEHQDMIELMRLAGEQVSQFVQRARAEEALARSAEQLAEAQALAEIGSWEWHVPTGEVSWSDETFRIFGVTREAFTPSYEAYFEAMHPEDRGRVRELVDACYETHEPLDFVHRALRPDGEVRLIRARGRVTLGEDGRPVTMLGTAQDITSLAAAEEKLRETQKLESLGVLAGGVAHDFNNLLVGILGNASLARTAVEPGSELDLLLAQIELAGARAAELAQQMLAYSGRGTFAPASRDLRAAVAEIAQLLAAAIPENVGVDLDFADDLPPIYADSGQLTQVLMNLLTNAAEAIGAERGTVRVRVELRDVDAATLETFSYADGSAPGSYVAIEVADTGVGMPEETVSRIFEPFFTTKFSGRGLGLAAVLGIVRAHGGAVKVTSAPGKGTTLTVLWPPAT